MTYKIEILDEICTPFVFDYYQSIKSILSSEALPRHYELTARLPPPQGVDKNPRFWERQY